MQFEAQTNYLHGMSETFSFANEEEWFAKNPDRIFRLHEAQTEHGNLAYPSGPERPEVEGMDANTRVFLIARVKACDAPFGFRVIVHEASPEALAAMRFGQYSGALDAFNHDSLGFTLLEAERARGNPSALNMLRLVHVPPQAPLPEPWRDWLPRFRE
jgi:hypothetical protein